MMNDGERVALARQGRPEGFRSIWEAYGRYIHTLAFRMLRDRALAEDAVQETFAAAFRSIREFRGDSRLKTWLYRIAYHEVLRVRERHLRGGGSTELPEDLPACDSAHADLEARLDVRAVLDRLPERDRAILIMAYWDDLSCAEIADVLSITANNVKILLYRARIKFAGLWPRADEARQKEVAS
ncbi:MAG TPA: RNA polymerase sigma factor [Candidatus Ozemobacteraceae bacterium]|nr:RNA polymerase sigma factor [Candidatus Ozemobacteraceae bacterium]